VALTFTLNNLTSLDAKRVNDLSRTSRVIFHFLDTATPAELFARLYTFT
jgi:hypothetical protein